MYEMMAKYLNGLEFGNLQQFGVMGYFLFLKKLRDMKDIYL
jgi:hypothetical protein